MHNYVRLEQVIKVLQPGKEKQIITPTKNKMMNEHNNPITIDYIMRTLRFNGYSPELEDTCHDGIQTIEFKLGPMIYKIDPTNLPYLRLSTACKMDHATDDITHLYQAANEVNSSVLVGKVVVIEYYVPIVFFNVEILCDTDLFFRSYFKTLMKNIDETIDQFLKIYDIIKDKDKILKEFTGAFKSNQQDELPF